MEVNYTCESFQKCATTILFCDTHRLPKNNVTLLCEQSIKYWIKTPTSIHARRTRKNWSCDIALIMWKQFADQWKSLVASSQTLREVNPESHLNPLSSHLRLKEHHWCHRATDSKCKSMDACETCYEGNVNCFYSVIIRTGD